MDEAGKIRIEQTHKCCLLYCTRVVPSRLS